MGIQKIPSLKRLKEAKNGSDTKPAVSNEPISARPVFWGAKKLEQNSIKAVTGKINISEMKSENEKVAATVVANSIKLVGSLVSTLFIMPTMTYAAKINDPIEAPNIDARMMRAAIPPNRF